MENKNTLNISLRTELKSRPSYKLRKAGKIPAVVYGVKEPICITVDEKEFETKYHKMSENIIIALLLNGEEKCHVLIKDYQDDILTGKIQHIDFYEVDIAKELKANIPVRVVGAPVGVKAGGIMEQLVHVMEVECLPKDIPEQIIVNVDKLDINEAVHVSEIPAIAGVKFCLPGDSVVVHITHLKAETPAAAAAPAADAAAAAAPAAEQK
ncbi:MAG: 50S ribosomal protein L25 [Spirochaetia bacterium]|nr:50S ribosomal protein L25 [Spirochaetia bacterium]